MHDADLNLRWAHMTVHFVRCGSFYNFDVMLDNNVQLIYSYGIALEASLEVYRSCPNYRSVRLFFKITGKM